MWENIYNICICIVTSIVVIAVSVFNLTRICSLDKKNGRGGEGRRGEEKGGERSGGELTVSDTEMT